VLAGFDQRVGLLARKGIVRLMQLLDVICGQAIFLDSRRYFRLYKSATAWPRRTCSPVNCT